MGTAILIILQLLTLAGLVWVLLDMHELRASSSVEAAAAIAAVNSMGAQLSAVQDVVSGLPKAQKPAQASGEKKKSIPRTWSAVQREAEAKSEAGE